MQAEAKTLHPRRRDRPCLVSISPARAWGMSYVARHGFGYSIFEYQEEGIASELTLYVAMDASVKFAR